jgi:hypothetical protein
MVQAHKRRRNQNPNTNKVLILPLYIVLQTNYKKDHKLKRHNTDLIQVIYITRRHPRVLAVLFLQPHQCNRIRGLIADDHPRQHQILGILLFQHQLVT